jgi:hypothetical protein
MKSTTMNLTWNQSPLMEVAVRDAAPRPTVRDSLWVSLMSASRSLDSALEDRLMGFPRRPAARGALRAAPKAQARSDARARLRRVAVPAEDLAYVILGISSVALLAYCFWQMCLSVS